MTIIFTHPNLQFIDNTNMHCPFNLTHFCHQGCTFRFDYIELEPTFNDLYSNSLEIGRGRVSLPKRHPTFCTFRTQKTIETRAPCKDSKAEYASVVGEIAEN